MGLNVVSDSLTWERVFNGDLNPSADLAAAQLAAKASGYAFMTFEGELYTSDRHTGDWVLAAQSANMLAEGSAAVVSLRENIRKRDERIEIIKRELERAKDAIAKTTKRAAEAEERCERQSQTIAALRDAATTRVRTDSGRGEAAGNGDARRRAGA